MPTCDGSGTSVHCDTTFEHLHCVCGLAMRPDARQCGMCVLEGTVPMDVDQVVWNGRDYPSWRNHRRLCPNPDAYLMLAKAIGGSLTNRDYALMWPPRKLW
jgi:hypothetical protein